MDKKRSRELSSPTGISPRQVVKRAYHLGRGDQVKGRRRLTYSSEAVYRDPPKPAGRWTAAEDKALVDYVQLTGPGNSWPNTINEHYWSSVSLFVHQKCCVPKRTCKDLITCPLPGCIVNSSYYLSC